MILKKYQIVSAQSVYGPLEKQKMFTGCSDAMHRGGIVPNPGQPVSILIKVFSLTKKLIPHHIHTLVKISSIKFLHFYYTRMMTQILQNNAILKILMKLAHLVQMDGLDEEETDNAFKYIEAHQLTMTKHQGQYWLLNEINVHL